MQPDPTPKHLPDPTPKDIQNTTNHPDMTSKFQKYFSLIKCIGYSVKLKLKTVTSSLLFQIDLTMLAKSYISCVFFVKKYMFSSGNALTELI